MDQPEENRFSFEVRGCNLEGFADFDWIELTSGISVLTGRNNVGKSRFLSKVADLGGRSLRDSALRIPLPAARIRDSDYSFELSFDRFGKLLHYLVSRHSQPLFSMTCQFRDNTWSQERVYCQSNGGSSVDRVANAEPGSIPMALSFPEGARLRSALERLIYLPPLRRTPASAFTRPKLVPASNGEDLANVMYTHFTRRTKEFHLIEATMASMYPEIDNLLTPATQDNQVTLKYRDKYSDDDVSLDDAGTGVGQTLHIVASVILHDPGRIFLIDEPHAYLHPMVERLLVEFLRQHGEHWYVCATHSPVFINAALPEHTWLVARNDQRGTRMRSIFNERLTRRDVLTELGIRPGDVAFAERVIFVEGPTEAEALPILLRRLGWDPSHHNCAVIQIEGTGTTKPIAKVARELDRLLDLDFAICLDGDAKREYGHLPNVRFLPVRDFEDLLLGDAAAIREGLLEDFDTPVLAPRGVVEAAWSVERVEQFIAQKRCEKPDRQAYKILDELAREMGTAYQKTLHGPRIAQGLQGNIVEIFRPVFSDFFAGQDQSGEGPAKVVQTTL